MNIGRAKIWRGLYCYRLYLSGLFVCLHFRRNQFVAFSMDIDDFN